MSRSTPLLGLLTLLFALPPAVAQDQFASEEQTLANKAVKTLSQFANQAKSRKVGQRAKQAFDLILAYDPDHSASRRALDFMKKDKEWVLEPPEKRTQWVDKASYENRFRTADDWYKVCIKLSEFHKKLGLQMKEAGVLGRATWHLEKAVYYNAMDEEANLALGYERGPNFFGTAKQIAMAAKMKEIETTAIEIARKDYPVEALPLETMPEEFVNLSDNIPDWMKEPSFDIHGSKSEHFTVWTRGSQENADNAVKWGERALDFGIYLIGDEKRAKQLQFVERASRAYAWRGFVWTGRERDEFLQNNPHVWAKDGSIERAKEFANNVWRSKQGGAVLLRKLAPVQIHDAMIAYVFNDGLVGGRNVGMGQGIIHSATWYMQATAISRWGARPTGTVGSDDLSLPDMATWWLRKVRDQATSTTDWPAEQVPREQLSRFRNDCRLKTWSFTMWLMAAYPDKWLDYYVSLPVDKIATLEEIHEIAQKRLDGDINAIDAEWREWARGDSGVAFATGYGPPLLPERPSKEELAVLDRLNTVRATNLTYTWTGTNITEGEFAGLPECQLDAESSLACESHAMFLTMHPEEHLKWPEAHEENPALEGFTPRGQRAGMGSVIIHRAGLGSMEFARDSIDGWLGTPYHRFPLLEHNINRIGYSYLYENDITVAVLDMGSLREPYDPRTAPKFILWPPPEMKGVPTSFHGIEHPNPLQDQPEDQQDITQTGYPVSLQLQSEVAGQLADSDIELWESRKGGRPPAKNFTAEGQADFRAWADRCRDQVPIWKHTPKVPLNKRMEIRDVVFCIPKEKLDSNKTFQARVKLQIGGTDPHWFIWEFSTGSQREGLKLK